MADLEKISTIDVYRNESLVSSPVSTISVTAGGLGPQGMQGPVGDPGTKIYSGTTAPGNGIGSNGDFYLNTTTGDMYGPKASGSWGSPVLSVKGTNGSNGSNGTDGKTVRTGSGVPSSGLGDDGDFYINTANYTIYGPKTSGAWGSSSSLVGPAGATGSAGSTGATGAAGNNGWSPILAIVTDGARRVHQVIDWTGGQGTKPTTGQYVSDTGLTSTLASATDIRGAAGATGATGSAGATGSTGAAGAAGEKGWSPILAIVADGVRFVQQVTDWVGGAGTKPTAGQYVGSSGFVTPIASAVDIRGPQGAAGATGATGATGPAGTPSTATMVGTIGTALVAGNAGVSIVYDNVGNTITITNTGTGQTTYTVDLTGADATGVSACDSVVSTACATVASFVSNTTGANAATVTLRFPPGKFRFTTDTAFNNLCKAPTSQYRGVVIEGPGIQGKRATMLSFESTATLSGDQTKNNLFTLFAQRQLTIRNLGFKSTNPALSLFYMWCSAVNDQVYTQFGSNGSNTGNNSYRFENIYLEGTWLRIWGADGDTKANQNSEIKFTGFTTSNSLSIADCIFRFGFPLYSAVFIATNSSAPTSGTWTATVDGQTTASLAYNVSAAALQTALQGLSSVGSGNATVTGSSSAGYVVKFSGAVLGIDTTLVSVASSVSPVSFKVFRYTPQMSQFLNYHFVDNEFEYGNGHFMILNSGGFVSFDGYHSMINGMSSAGYGNTWFIMENISGRADDMAHLAIRDARFEFRSANCKLIDTYWGDVNKYILMQNIGIATNVLSQSVRDAIEVMAFRSGSTAQAHVLVELADIPGYVTVQNTGSVGTAGGTLKFSKVRFKSQTTPALTLYVDQTALAAGTSVIRALGGARVRFEDSTGSAGSRITATTLGLTAAADGVYVV